MDGTAMAPGLDCRGTLAEGLLDTIEALERSAERIESALERLSSTGRDHGLLPASDLAREHGGGHELRALASLNRGAAGRYRGCLEALRSGSATAAVLEEVRLYSTFMMDQLQAELRGAEVVRRVLGLVSDSTESEHALAAMIA